MAERVVFHIDVNSAFLSWSAVDLLQKGGTFDYRTVPSAVAKHSNGYNGIILAKSVPAKKFDIKTGDVVWQAKQKCPQLKLLKPNYDLYLRAGNSLQVLLKKYSPFVEPFSIDECFLEYTGLERIWGEPLKAAHLIKDAIKKELGFTVNVGVGSNKSLAKMASEFEKPDKVHHLFKEEIKEKLWCMPVDFLFMAGRQTVKRLLKYGISTIGDVANIGESAMTSWFGKNGQMLWRYATGIDYEPVRDGIQDPPQSMGKAITLPFIADFETGKAILLYLLTVLVHKLQNYEYRANVISVAVKDKDRFYKSGRTRLLIPADDLHSFYDDGAKLLKSIWPKSGAIYIGVTLTDFKTEDGVQFLFDDDGRGKQSRLSKTIYDLKNRYGSDIIQPATLLHQPVSELFRQITDEEQITFRRFF